MNALVRLGALLRLAWEGVRRRPLSSLLTMLAVALGVALVVLLATFRHSTENSYRDAARGYDVILAPPHGSPLQAVLSTLFHVDVPGGTLAWPVYEEALRDARVAAAVPYALGDTYKGHRVIGTTRALFETLRGADGERLDADIEGRLFRPRIFEAVVGSAVARRTGLGLGDGMSVTHGLAEGGHAHDEVWTVVGMMRPTGTPHDRAIYIPIDTFYAIAGHESAAPRFQGSLELEETLLEGGDPYQDRALSAVGIRLRAPALRLAYLQEFRTGRTDAQAVLPTDQVQKLLQVVGGVDRAFQVVAWLVTIVAGLTVLVGLYNTIHGRRREIAVLRALGARRRHVFTALLLEAVLLGLGGGLAGLVLGHAAAAAAAPTILERYGIRVDPSLSAFDLKVVAGLLGIVLVAGLLPAWRGLSTPVADNLQSEA